jgi:hypothetical protein
MKKRYENNVGYIFRVPVRPEPMISIRNNVKNLGVDGNSV